LAIVRAIRRPAPWHHGPHAHPHQAEDPAITGRRIRRLNLVAAKRILCHSPSLEGVGSGEGSTPGPRRRNCRLRILLREREKERELLWSHWQGDMVTSSRREYSSFICRPFGMETPFLGWQQHSRSVQFRFGSEVASSKADKGRRDQSL